MYKKLRFFFRFLTAIFTKYFLALSLGIFLGICSFFLSPKLLKIIPSLRTTYSIGIVGRFTQSDIPLSIQEKISIGLTVLDKSGLPTPAISSSWSVDESGKTYTFNINPKITWQDGTFVKSQDINYQFRDTETIYPTNHQVVIKLKDPFAALPSVVSRPIFKKGLLGVGSYKATKVRKNGSYIETLTLSSVDRKSFLPTLVYRFYPTETQARTAFKLGEVDTIEDLVDPQELLGWPNSQVATIPHLNRYVAVFFNTSDPILSGQSGRNLRLSLAYAIDKSPWDRIRAISPINPDSWAYNADVKKYDLDLNRAKQLLKSVEKTPDSLTISTLPAYHQVAEQVKKDWEKLGIQSEIKIIPEIPSDFQVLIFAQAIPSDPDQYNQWHSTQSTNLTNFHSPRIDKLLEDGRQTLDFEKRRQIYMDFQKYLVEEVPAVFLYHPSSFTLTRH